MRRYIDAGEVLEQIRKKLGIKSLSYLLEAERQIVNAIQSAPSIDIVFCKECKYAHMTYGGECKYCDIWFPDEPVYLRGDDYCSFGERKESE